MPIQDRFLVQRSMPDLHDVHHHPGVPAPTPSTPTTGSPDHLRSRGTWPSAAGRDEPASPRHPWTRSSRLSKTSTSPDVGGHRCGLTTPLTSSLPPPEDTN